MSNPQRCRFSNRCSAAGAISGRQWWHHENHCRQGNRQGSPHSRRDPSPRPSGGGPAAPPAPAASCRDPGSTKMRTTLRAELLAVTAPAL